METLPPVLYPAPQAMAMVTDDLKKLANDIFRAQSDDEVHRLLAPLSTEETEELAQLLEMGAMKAWVERERAKGRPRSELTWVNCVRELGLLP
jgi:hypothetical protein